MVPEEIDCLYGCKLMSPSMGRSLSLSQPTSSDGRCGSDELHGLLYCLGQSQHTCSGHVDHAGQRAPGVLTWVMSGRSGRSRTAETSCNDSHVCMVHAIRMEGRMPRSGRAGVRQVLCNEAQ